jgi:glycosyltransferase involved in cell wall biosynthesis
VLVVNKESEKIFGKYQYQRVIPIPLGYDPNIFFPDSTLRECYRIKLNASADTILVAYFGRLVPQKGVHLLVEALAKMKSLNWMLLLDDEFDSHNEYAQRIQLRIEQLGLRQRVIRFEADHFEIANYMRAADVMVAPSLTTPEFKEQYGRAVQEAMACGCTCLVADSGHLPDLVGNPRLVFKENNGLHLQEKLTELILSATLRNAYSAELYARAKGHLTIQVQARELSRILLANRIELTS